MLRRFCSLFSMVTALANRGGYPFGVLHVAISRFDEGIDFRMRRNKIEGAIGTEFTVR